MLIRAGTVDLDPPRRSTTVVPPVSFPPVSLPAATAPVPQRGTASVKSSPSQKFPSSSPAALLPDAARSRTASTAAKSVLLTNYALMVDDALWAGTSRCRLNFGRLTRNIMVGTTSFECDRFVKYVHRHIERPSETLARVETKKLPPGVPAKFPGPNGLQFCFFFQFFTLTLLVFVAVLDCLLCLVGEIRHLGKFGGLVPLPYRCVVICFLAFASLLFVATALTPLGAGHSKTLFGGEDCSSVNQGYDLEVPLVRIQIPARHGSHTKKRPVLV